LHFDTGRFGNLSATVMDDIFAKIFAQIGPTTTNTNHDALSVLSHSTDKELGRCCLASMMQMV
jgi:hypothetical protein